MKRYNFLFFPSVLLFISLLANGQESSIVLPHNHVGLINGTVFSPDGRFILSYGNSPEFFLWEANTGKLIRVFKSIREQIIKFADFSPNGKYIVAVAGGNLHGESIVFNIDNEKIAYSSDWDYDRDKIYFNDSSDQIIFLQPRRRLEVGDLKTGRLVLDKLAEEDELFHFVNKNLWIIGNKKIVEWDVKDNKELKVFNVDALNVAIKNNFYGDNNYHFSNSGKYLFLEKGNNITLIKISTGDTILEFKAGRPGDDLMYKLSEDENVLLWYVPESTHANSQEIRGFNLKDRKSYSFFINLSTKQYSSSDYTTFLIKDKSFFILSDQGNGDKKTSFYTYYITKHNVFTGEKEQEWKLSTPVYNFFIFSKYLIINSDQKERGEEKPTYRLPLLKIIDLMSESSVHNLPGYAASSKSFSPKYDQISLLYNHYQGVNYVSNWHLNPFKKIASMKGSNLRLESLSFLDDYHLIINNRIINVNNGSTSKQITGTFIHMNKRKTVLLSVRTDSVLQLYETKKGTLIGNVYGSFEAMDNIEYLVTSQDDSLNIIWNYNTGKKLAEIKGKLEFTVYSDSAEIFKYLVLLSQDSTPLVYTFSGNKIVRDKKIVNKILESTDRTVTTPIDFHLPESPTMEILDSKPKRKEKHEYFNSANDTTGLEAVEFLKHDYVIGIYNEDSVVIKSINGDFKSRKIKLIFPTAENRYLGRRWNFLRISDDRTFLFFNEGDDSYVVNISNGKFFPIPFYFAERIINCWFSKNDSIIYIWSRPFTAFSNIHSFTAFHIRSGKKIFNTFGIDQYPLFSFSSDRKLVAIYNQGKIQIFSSEKAQLLFDYISIDSTNYLVVDNDNHYDGTESARNLLYFTCGTEIIGLDQVKDQLWVPNLAERIMNGEAINAKTLDELNICGLTPQVEDESKNENEYRFKILPRRGGLGETVLYINGIEVKRYKPEQLQKNGGVYELVVKKEELSNYFIAGKENPVTVKAYTADNAISSRGLIIKKDKTKEATVAPNLYAVMVGVSDYKGDELDLKYAAKDATDMSNAVSVASKKLLNGDGKEHVFMYNLTTATDRYQLPEKNSIKKTLEEIGKKANANDILLIFFAGHGVMQGDANKKQFYFLTADASKASSIDATSEVGISTAELTEWMKPSNIKAQKRIMIFDACNSGQAIRDFVKHGDPGQDYVVARNDEKGQQIKAIEKLNNQSGLFILAASASDQNAYEMGRYSQGLLTYSLLKAIKQQPDILENGKYLDVSNWLNAAKKTVSDVASKTGKRQEPQLNASNNFNIGMVDEDVRSQIILSSEKPLFARSNFQNVDTKLDNIKLRTSIDKELLGIGIRSTDAPITYSADYEGTDAYALTGDYKITGSTITVSVLLIKGGTEILQRYETKGTITDLNGLVTSITATAMDLLKKHK